MRYGINSEMLDDSLVWTLREGKCETRINKLCIEGVICNSTCGLNENKEEKHPPIVIIKCIDRFSSRTESNEMNDAKIMPLRYNYTINIFKISGRT